MKLDSLLQLLQVYYQYFAANIDFLDDFKQMLPCSMSGGDFAIYSTFF